MSRAAVITVSDSCSRGEREDLSGPAVASRLNAMGFDVSATEIVPDELTPIREAIIRQSSKAVLVVTTGGTGISPRDVTPEATREICDRIIEGLAEHMRSVSMRSTPMAALSRAVCGSRGKTLVINLPGSPRGALESLDAIATVIPHALDLLEGKTAHPTDARTQPSKG